VSPMSLPYIAGNLGATSDQSTWVLTSYLVSNVTLILLYTTGMATSQGVIPVMPVVR